MSFEFFQGFDFPVSYDINATQQHQQQAIGSMPDFKSFPAFAIQPQHQQFIPQPPQPTKPAKSKFTLEEDEVLTQLVMTSVVLDWNQIAAKMPNRNPRQCRERWQNYLDPHLTQNEWTEEEDKLIIQKQEELGPRWNAIARFFKGRSGNSIRNRYLMIQRHNEKKAKKASLQQRIQSHYNQIQQYPQAQQMQQQIIQRPIMPVEQPVQQPVQKPLTVVKQEPSQVQPETIMPQIFPREDSTDKLFSLDNSNEFDFLDDFMF